MASCICISWIEIISIAQNVFVTANLRYEIKEKSTFMEYH